MTSREIRQSFLDFFKSKQHTVVPSSSLLPDAPNLLFTNAGMNQFVPIFLGQVKPHWTPPRVADTQKCIRAGGKHNDLEDVGLDTYHHTFFEMLGNWSFGDYFKREAIDWAWELLVEQWKFPKERLYATYFGGDEKTPADIEVRDLWLRYLPAGHVLPGGRKDNFWMMGDTGPCGPCSEIHMDLTPAGDTQGRLVNAGDARCIEIWNLVFIQSNANPDGTFSPLPAKHVDTGMGFERVCAVMQCTNGLKDFSRTISNYETDVFAPIFRELERLSGKQYASTLPQNSSTPAAQHSIDIAFRVIADHTRCLSFAIADGIAPSNEGRGYVLRRILRRAARYGSQLGLHGPFLYKLVNVLAKTVGDVFPEIPQRKSNVEFVIQTEETSFSRRLEVGISLFTSEVDWRRQARERADRIIDKQGLLSAEERLDEQGFLTDPSHGKGLDRLADTIRVLDSNSSSEILKKFCEFKDELSLLSGGFAFELYDTFGFPLDLTELMARERGLTVDVTAFEKLMEEQRRRAREDHEKKKAVITVGEGTVGEKLRVAPTKFLGYENLEAEAVVVAASPLVDSEAQRAGSRLQENEISVVLDQTPFYAEAGGQVGDTGFVHVPGHDWTEVGRLTVLDTQKQSEVHVHRAKLLDGRAPDVGEVVRVAVDVQRRANVQRHHTVTHLFHWALHEVVSRDARQRGSLVAPDRLRFDFNHPERLTEQQIADIERLVDERIRENAPVFWFELPYNEVKGNPNIMQFFGDKYGAVVRIVQIGGHRAALDGFSIELCGGTHTRATGEIGLFKITRESAISAGVRRVEAVSGQFAAEFVEKVKEDTSAETERAKAAEAQKAEERRRKAERQQRAPAIAEKLPTQGVVVENLGEADADLLRAVVDALKPRLTSGIVVLTGVSEGKVSLICYVSPDQVKAGKHAGKIVGELAKICGGGGGGRPDLAQAGGKRPEKLDEALAVARQILQ